MYPHPRTSVGAHLALGAKDLLQTDVLIRLFFGQDPDDPLPVNVLLRTFDERFGGYRALAVHYVWEDLFWRRKHERVEWLEGLIRL